MLDELETTLGSRRIALETLAALVRKRAVVHAGGRLWTAADWEALPMPPNAEPFDPPLPSGKRQCDIYDLLATLGPLPREALCDALADAIATVADSRKDLRRNLHRALDTMAENGVVTIADGIVKLA
jgi:hypothetical protein